MKILYFDNGLCNTYIVKDKKILQIDAGSKTNIKPDILILTHSHFDHTSFIPKNCEIWCSKECKEHVESNDIVTLIPFFDFKKRRIKVSKILKDGDIISLGNIKLKVIKTPGHTDGSICLFDEKSRILFSGDTWFGNDIYGRTDLPSGDYQQLKDSIKKLKKLKPVKIYPGH